MIVPPGALQQLYTFVHDALGDSTPQGDPQRTLGGAEVAAVLVNGIGTNSRSSPLRHLGVHLSPGFGRWDHTYASDKVSGYSRLNTVSNPSLKSLSDGLEAQVNSLPQGLKFVVVGHSQGGLITATWVDRFATNYGGRFLGAAFIAVPWRLPHDLDFERTDLWPPGHLRDPRSEKARDYIQRLSESIDSDIGRHPVSWPANRFLVQMCAGDEDKVLHAGAYTGRWREGDVTVSPWRPPAAELDPLLPHTRICRDAYGTVRDWLANLPRT
jgi:pimeloyl-ACP methyl ester carboxylesterase